jgi:hypothetical protein
VIKDYPVTDENYEKLKRWKSEFTQDFKYHQTWWNKKREWERFYDGDQLSQEEKAALAGRGQPEVVINLIKPRIDAIIGDYLGRRMMIRARDKGSADFDKAKYITEALRYVEEMNRFDEAETNVAKNLFISGVGWYKCNLEFDFLEPEIKISYRNNNDVILDRRCRRTDLKDAKRLWETVWVEVGDIVEMYPDFKDEIERSLAVAQESFNALGTYPNKTTIGDDYATSENVTADTIDMDTFLDPERKRIRLINVWERVQKRIEFAFHPSLEGSVVEVTEYSKDEMSAFKTLYPNAQYFTRTRWEINSGIFISNKILEDKQNVRPHDSEGKFPFSRALGNVEHETFMPYGIVKQYVDAQKEYNKRRSKLLHKTNTNRIIAEEGAVADIERTRKEAARPDGVVIYKAGKQFQIDKDNPDQSDVYLLNLAQSEVEATGVAKEFAGQEDKQLSGKAIQLRQITSDKMLRQYYASLRSARRDIFGIALEDMQQYWTSEKLVKITDDPNAQGIVLNQRIQDQMTGQVYIMNDLRLGKYDIKIDEDMETPNQRYENFVQLTQLAPAIIQSGQPFPIEMLINASDMPGKNELVQQIMAEKQRQLQIAQAQAQTAQAQAVAAHAQTMTGAANGQNVPPT